MYRSWFGFPQACTHACLSASAPQPEIAEHFCEARFNLPSRVLLEETRAGNKDRKAFSGPESCIQAKRSVFKSQCSADLGLCSAAVGDFIGVAIAGSLGPEGNPFVVLCMGECVVSFCCMSFDFVYNYVNGSTYLFKGKHLCKA